MSVNVNDLINHNKTRSGEEIELSKKCIEILNLKGHQAVRLSYLYDGDN